jgi:hypothetical protein
MAKLNTYYTVPPTLDDILFGTDNTIPSRTRNFTVAGLFALYNTTYNVIPPTLQIVTTNGAITTNTVYLNGGALSNSINEQAIFQPDLISTVNLNSGSGASLDSTGKLALSPDGLVSTLFASDNITQDITLQAPNKTAGSYTLATTDDILPVTGFVPYTGATEDVDLGEFEIKAGQVEFDQTPTGTAGVGVMRWNDSDGTVDLGLKGGNVTLQVGQEQVLRVVNKTATNINLLEANYQAVRVTGAQGQRLKVDLAQATNDTLSAETIGLVTETINNNQEGFITTSGLVRGINTTGSLQGETWEDGDILYLSPTTAGNATKVKPVAPNHLIILGYVIRAHINQGSIFVKVDNGYELDELHNVKITSAANNNVLAYTSATDIWENKTVETALGYTPFELPSLTSGSVLFSNGTTIAQDNANLFWDDTNNRLGINKNNPTVTIDAVGNEYQFAATSGAINFYNTPGVNQPFNFSNLRQNSDYIFKQNVNGAVNTNVLILKGLSGNVLINTATDAGFKLDVNGTARVSGNLTIDNLNCNAVRGSFFNTFNNGYTVFKSFTASGNAAFYNSVSVGTTATPVASAVLEAVSTTKGFLPPRMTTTQRDAIATPAAGLMVYDSSSLAPSIYNGVNWQNVLIPNSSGNVGIGTNTPSYKLQIAGTEAVSAVRSNAGYDIYPVPAPTSLSGVVSAGGSVDTGIHGYYLTYKTAIGETDPKGPISITTTAGNNTVTLTLPISTDERVIARKIYRTKVGSIYNEYLLVTINDNTTTTYVDTADDSTLTAEYRNSYYRANTTTNYITVGGVKAMTVDPKATYFGFNAGVSATSAGYNAFFGSDAGRYNTTGKSNTFIGYQAGYANTAGDANVVIGAQAGYNATGHVNSTIIGSLAGRYYNSGASNIATTTNSVFLGLI